MRRTLGIVSIVVLTVVASLAQQARDQLWAHYRDYRSPFPGNAPVGSSRATMSSRVVVALIRGLRLDASRQMPALNALRERGADVVVQLTAPTYRLPSWVGWMSGAQPETHGVTTNDSQRGVLPDSIFRQLRASGRSSAIVGSSEWDGLLGDTAGRIELAEGASAAQRDNEAVRIAIDVLRDTAAPAQLVLVELGLLEEVARNTPESYTAAAAATDVRLKELVDTLDLGNATLVVMSDRGLDARGRDGGSEEIIAQAPLVMAGSGVTPNVQTRASAADIAPTLAALLGAPIPVEAQGAPIFEALQSNPQLPLDSAKQLTTFYEQWSEATGQPRFAAELLQRRQTGLAAGDPASYQEWKSELDVAVADAQGAKLSAERSARFPFVIGIALLLIAIAGIALSSRPWLPLIGAAFYFIAWYVVFLLVRDARFSLTMFRDGNPAPFLATAAQDSMLVLAGACIVVALSADGHDDAFDAIASVMSTLALITLIQIAQFVWFYWQWGDAFTWMLPESSSLVTAMVALTQASALNVRFTSSLPALPLPLAAAIGTALIYSAKLRLGHRSHHRRHGS